MIDQNPICWGLLCSSGMVEVVTDTEQELIDYKATDPDASEVIIPLYRHPQPTITAEEREAVEWAAIASDANAELVAGQFYAAAKNMRARSATLRSLLERLG